MPPAGGKCISVHGKEIHYFEQPGQGVPVVMIHGEPGSHKDFDPVVAELPGVHLISIDRPGFGWSKGGWLPYQEQIDVVHELLTALKLAPAVLVGHSFGGTLALGVARRYPQDVASLILVAPAAGGLRSNTMDVLQARFIRFSQWPVVRTVVDATVGDVIKRISATSGAENAFAPEPVDPAFEQRLLSVGAPRRGGHPDPSGRRYGRELNALRFILAVRRIWVAPIVHENPAPSHFSASLYGHSAANCRRGVRRSPSSSCDPGSEWRPAVATQFCLSANDRRARR
jgi:pimeloyl-ACP methyl ester carboxylesterase